ncbi:MAG: monofunctional biosynthetic peptidoglycan transglycosylase [Nitrosomonas sp.]|nr:monofunctional biosynthetic peptidoglycan transglycosylase [Nitrosomonas sp.]MDP1949943.1 monofunctional biosynthetic peptidoglycan transglycosylase [Nitrosomonas sp.]
MGKFFKRWSWRLIPILVGILFLYQLWIFGHILHWKNHDPTTSAFMQSQLNVLRTNNPKANLSHQWIAYEQISLDMKRAIIASEDGKFMQHTGFDVDALQSAFKKNLEENKFAVGGSTISQQLAKNLFLSNKKTIWRKAQETLITVMLEKILSKRRILEIYLNIIEWGNGVFGIEAAANHYYNIPASALTAKQATYLAAMVTNPRYYDENRKSPHLLKKSEIILKRIHSSKVP